MTSFNPSPVQMSLGTQRQFTNVTVFVDHFYDGQLTNLQVAVDGVITADECTSRLVADKCIRQAELNGCTIQYV